MLTATRLPKDTDVSFITEMIEVIFLLFKFAINKVFKARKPKPENVYVKQWWI